MNDTSLVKFDMNDLKTRVTSSIQAQFGMLIPQEVFDGMVAEAINEFFHNTSTIGVKKVSVPIKNTGYTTAYEEVLTLTETTTPFKLMVFQYLREMASKALDQYFASESEELQKNFDKVYESSDEFKSGVAKNVAAVISKAAEIEQHRAISNALALLKDQLRSSIYNSQNHFNHY